MLLSDPDDAPLLVDLWHSVNLDIPTFEQYWDYSLKLDGYEGPSLDEVMAETHFDSTHFHTSNIDSTLSGSFTEKD